MEYLLDIYYNSLSFLWALQKIHKTDNEMIWTYVS